MKIFPTVSLLIFLYSKAFADSPITSTDFFAAYNEISEVYNAAKSGVINYESASFLSSPTVSVDKKIALINALGWDTNGKHNRDLYLKFLYSKYKKDELKYAEITPDEHLCIGYLTIMDNYRNVREPLMILKDALARNPKSYTYNMVYGLVLAQMSLSPKSDSTFGWDLVDSRFIDEGIGNWCNIYLIIAKIEANKTLRQDFRIAAKRNIYQYINLYKKRCQPDDLVLIPSIPEIESTTSNSIRLIRKNGVFKIPVEINGTLALDFVLDSGASDVTVSNDVFSVLVKQGKISDNDILGYDYYTIADGSTIKLQSFLIRKLQVGNTVVNNVKASVGGSNTPLLLGQSFLQKFNQFTVDNENGLLILDAKPIR